MDKEVLGILQDSAELRKLIAENPESPIYVITRKGAVGEYRKRFYYVEVQCEIDCVFDYFGGEVFTDKEDFKDYIGKALSKDKKYANLPDDEFKKAVAEIAAAYEPFWKKVIAIYADT